MEKYVIKYFYFKHEFSGGVPGSGEYTILLCINANLL